MKKTNPFFILKKTLLLLPALFLIACSNGSDDSSDKKSNSEPKAVTGTFTIQDSNGSTLFPETSYSSDIDLRVSVIKLSLVTNQIGWIDQEGNIYPSNSIIKNCNGNKIFKASCCKTSVDSVGDIRLSDGKFVTASQMKFLKNNLAKPVSVVISITAPDKLEMALEFPKCKFWTDDSQAAAKYNAYGCFTNISSESPDGFPDVLFNLYSASSQGSKNGHEVYETWCEEISDGDSDKYPAFYFAENCRAGGFTDWYLPTGYEIDGPDFDKKAPAIVEALKACGFNSLFENTSNLISYSNEVYFPAFWFYRMVNQKCLQDVWTSDCVTHTSEYACAVRKFK